MTSTLDPKKNPFRTIYLQNSATYRELAERYNTQVSVLQRMTEGASNSASDRALAIFSDMSGIKPETIKEYYDTFIRWDFKENVKLPQIPLNEYATKESWLLWRKELCELNKVEDTRLNVAALLHVAVNVIANWETGKTGKLPLQLLSRSRGRFE